MLVRPAGNILILCGFLLLPACAHHGMAADGTTVSFGDAYEGFLVRGVRLPARGDGYWVPSRWTHRNNQYGTDELVSMIVRVGRRLEQEQEGPSMGVADLSPALGGPSIWHQSHQTGRDVDLMFFAIDRRGRPLKTDAMVRFKADGSSHRIDSHGIKRSRRYFDVARNWALVRAVLQEPTVVVQNFYVYEPLKQLMIDHARELGEPNWLISRADALIEQPQDSSAHDDHFHIRIYCPQGDRGLGCEDGGGPDWTEQFVVMWESLLEHTRVIAVVSEIVRALPPV